MNPKALNIELMVVVKIEVHQHGSMTFLSDYCDDFIRTGDELVESQTSFCAQIIGLLDPSGGLLGVFY